MKRALCAMALMVCPLIWPITELHADTEGPKEESPTEQLEISSEDRDVIRLMELLALMELLEDMELLEGEIAVSEDTK